MDNRPPISRHSRIMFLTIVFNLEETIKYPSNLLIQTLLYLKIRSNIESFTCLTETYSCSLDEFDFQLIDHNKTSPR